MPRIRGTAFRDDDADGVRDAGEPGLPYCSVLATPGGWMIGADDQGRFEVQVPYGAYTITGQPRIHHTITTSAQAASFGFPMQIDSLNDVGYAPTPGITDLVASITASVARPGFGTTITITVTNMGTTDATVDVQLLADAIHTWTSSSVPPSTLNGNAATWNVTITAGASWQCVVSVDTPQSVLLGTPLSHTLSATTGATDATPLDNEAVWNALVVGSFDPNDKIVEPASLTPADVAAGMRVTYTVRFQNTGTFAAERVLITDTLNSDALWSTLAPLASSHANTWFIRVAFSTWCSRTSTCPTASDEPGSHGFVTFNVVPSTSLMLGESVGNIANIYFDYNEPVITNEAVFIVDEDMTVLVNEQDAMRVWPNPVGSELFASGASSGAYEVMDALGRVVLRGNAANLSRGVEVGHLPAGCYSLRLAAGATVSFCETLRACSPSRKQLRLKNQRCPIPSQVSWFLMPQQDRHGPIYRLVIGKRDRAHHLSESITFQISIRSKFCM
ncbi:MAG: hypothetical protein IPL52_05415 [Flavobacteriales bacterium]|nr:hypothetical protein [Flavobacteriales bacterium]